MLWPLSILLNMAPLTNQITVRMTVKAFNELYTSGQIEVCTFHQSYSYEEFVEGWRGNEESGFNLEDGVFKRICNAALSSSHRPNESFQLVKILLNSIKCPWVMSMIP